MNSTAISKLTQLLNTSKKIDKILTESKCFSIDSRSYSLKSLEGVMEYSVVLKPRNNNLRSGKHVFSNIDLRRISVVSAPDFLDQERSISTVVDNGLTKSFVLDPRLLDAQSAAFNFKFEIECEVEPITRDLVQRDHQIDVSTDESNTYWLSAEMKELGSVIPLLRRMNLSDIPFVMNVAVHQDIKTKFPTRRQRELDLIAKWAHELDRNKKGLLSFEHLKLKRSKPEEKDITKILVDLQAIFLPSQFCSFIDVSNDFYYSDCLRGADFYDQIPFKTFPKWMSIVCRTDISTEKPASQGELVYKKSKFQEAIEEAIMEK